MTIRSFFRYSPLFVALAGLFALTAFMLPRVSGSRVDEVRAYYLHGIETFGSRAESFRDAVAGKDVAAARRSFAEARDAYKRVEFMVGYFDRWAAEKVNGAPLVKVDESDIKRGLINPEGFQVIEEMLFGDDPTGEWEEIRRLAERLGYRATKMAEYASTLPIEDRHIFEAMREELLRVGLVGITGFDSPARLNSIPEARMSLAGVRDAFALYAPDLKRSAPSTARRIDALFETADAFLAADDDFESFDRLTFIRSYINPLYSELLGAHYALGFPTYSQEIRYNRPVRYEADAIFSPDAFNAFFYSPDAKDFYDESRAELGRTLFFDPILSENTRRSCASCHHPDEAFTDGRPTSLDITAEGKLRRNAPTMINAAFQSKFFWDGRTEHLEHQIEDVLLNHSEMNSTFESIIDRLRQSPDYRRMFASAYDGMTDTAITKYGVTRALATYIRTLTGLNSEFDRYMRGENETIDPSVARGFNVFMGKASCGTCHFAPLFSGTVPPAFIETETEVLGITVTPDSVNPVLDNDPGRFGRHLDDIYRRSFKTVSVRNVELTAPYMHNGAFGTLEEVIDFYDRGGGQGMGLDVPNQTLPPDRLNLSEREKKDLIAFMHSLTDTAGTSSVPASLPKFPAHAEWNGRKVGGEY